MTMDAACRHPLCALIGGACSLAAGVSRGCRAGPRPDRAIAPEVIDRVRALLAQLDPAARAQPGVSARQVDAATELAQLIRREARDDRNLLVLVRTEELEPELATRLEALCRRTPAGR
ncbi:MAG: hypothetical protein IPL61_27090 [Myxococcales bacterium]|nr:hypothetical protein [Myxococcales bacterium]